MLVWIVVAALPDNSGMDVARMNKVEDLDPDAARAMLNAGTARIPTDAELAEHRGDSQDDEDPDRPVDGPRPVADEPYKTVPADQPAETDKPVRPRKGDGEPAEAVAGSQ